MEYNIYRLKEGQPKNFQLPLKNTFVKKFVEENGQKVDKGFRRIKYVPGVDTIFAEDIQGDLKPQSIWFVNGQLEVRKDDKLLNEIMTQHPWFNQRYALWSEDIEINEKLKNRRNKSYAEKLIDDADKNKIKAIALAIFGPEAISWSEEKSELKLREKAAENPKDLTDTMQTKDYQSRLIAGLSFVKGIVKENQNRTAVVWTDSEGTIIKLAKGENGIKELGRYLSQANDESKMVMQAIGERLDAVLTNTETEPKSDLEKENALLRAKLEELQKSQANTPEGESKLQDARAKYKSLFKKDVPNNKKNDLEWLEEKILEKENE